MNDIVIHGASSFIGKHFIKFLISKEVDLYIFARETSDISFCENIPKVKIYRYNKTISEMTNQSISIRNPVFFEFSWYGVFGSERNMSEQIEVNIPLIISSITFARKLNAKHWIGIGSQAEYGSLNKKINENDVCNPVTLYGKSKLISSMISKELCRIYNIDHSWLRLFSVYGPDDNHEWLISYLIKKMLENSDVNVTKGEQKWDYLYVDDIIEMLWKIKDARGVGIANLGSGKSYSIKKIIETIKNLTHSSSKILYGAIPYRTDQIMYMQADISKLTSHLDWNPKATLKDGLSKTIEAYQKK